MLSERSISRRARSINVTREFRKGEVHIAKKKLIGWGARILEGRTAMLRKAGRKMTQGDLGKAAGVSAQQISRYEAEVDEPSYDTWVRLGKALLMTPGDLVFGNTHVPIEEGVEQPVQSPTRSRRSLG